MVEVGADEVVFAAETSGEGEVAGPCAGVENPGEQVGGAEPSSETLGPEFWASAWETERTERLRRRADELAAPWLN